MRFIRAFSVGVARQHVAQPWELKASYLKQTYAATGLRPAALKNQDSTARFKARFLFSK